MLGQISWLPMTICEAKQIIEDKDFEKGINDKE